MRRLFGMILLASSAELALAHTLEGGGVAALSHQLLGMHHLLLPVVLIAAVFYLGRSWHRSNRVE